MYNDVQRGFDFLSKLHNNDADSSMVHADTLSFGVVEVFIPLLQHFSNDTFSRNGCYISGQIQEDVK